MLRWPLIWALSKRWQKARSIHSRFVLISYMIEKAQPRNQPSGSSDRRAIQARQIWRESEISKLRAMLHRWQHRKQGNWQLITLSSKLSKAHGVDRQDNLLALKEAIWPGILLRLIRERKICCQHHPHLLQGTPNLLSLGMSPIYLNSGRKMLGKRL